MIALLIAFIVVVTLLAYLLELTSVERVLGALRRWRAGQSWQTAVYEVRTFKWRTCSLTGR
jgi:hypothetical protein